MSDESSTDAMLIESSNLMRHYSPLMSLHTGIPQVSLDILNEIAKRGSLSSVRSGTQLHESLPVRTGRLVVVVRPDVLENDQARRALPARLASSHCKEGPWVRIMKDYVKVW